MLSVAHSAFDVSAVRNSLVIIDFRTDATPLVGRRIYDQQAKRLPQRVRAAGRDADGELLKLG